VTLRNYYLDGVINGALMFRVGTLACAGILGRDGPDRNGGPLMNPAIYGVLFVVLAPVFGGLLAGVDRIVSARMQGRVGPPLLQPFYDVGKLLQKQARQVNPVVEPLLLGHVGFMAVSGALLLSGTDLIFIAFVFALAALFLVLAAGSVNSPYSFAGAERELVVLLASEPFFILMMAAICKVTGASTYAGRPGIAPARGRAAARRAARVSARRHHQAAQIAVRHLHSRTTPTRSWSAASRRTCRAGCWPTSELAHWYESALLCAFMVLLFNWSIAARLGRLRDRIRPRGPRGQLHLEDQVAAGPALDMDRPLWSSREATCSLYSC
jgi:ech hydrogenase subunit B